MHWNLWKSQFNIRFQKNKYLHENESRPQEICVHHDWAWRKCSLIWIYIMSILPLPALSFHVRTDVPVVPRSYTLYHKQETGNALLFGAWYSDQSLKKAKPRRQMHFCHKDTQNGPKVLGKENHIEFSLSHLTIYWHKKLCW